MKRRHASWLFLSIFLLHFVDKFSTGIQVNVEVTSFESHHHAVEGDADFVLPCHSSLNVPVVWMYRGTDDVRAVELSNSGRIIDQYSSQFELDMKTPGDYNLVIESVRLEDSGVYTCDEDDGVGDRHLMKLNVSVRPPLEFQIESGQLVTIPCHSDVKSPVSWWRQSSTTSHPQVVVDKDEVQPDFIARFSLSSSHPNMTNGLSIQRAQVSDSGIYTCDVYT